MPARHKRDDGVGLSGIECEHMWTHWSNACFSQTQIADCRREINNLGAGALRMRFDLLSFPYENPSAKALAGGVGLIYSPYLVGAISERGGMTVQYECNDGGD